MNEKKTFDAVAASRRWKQAVAAETEGLTAVEKMAYFRNHSRMIPPATVKPELAKDKSRRG